MIAFEQRLADECRCRFPNILTMKLRHFYPLLIVLSIIHLNEGFLSDLWNSISTTFNDFKCKHMECCNKGWEQADFSRLELLLRSNVYGQQIVNEIVTKALKGHLRQSSPRSKALAMSFHGRPGVGKNYVARFIQNSLYDRGSRSKYAHFFAGRIHFPVASQADIYKMHLMDWIRGNVSRCEYSLFVFDEVDKMPQGVLDAVKPFIDYHEHIDGVDFRKSIFIFLSNTGGDLIAQQLLSLWEGGLKREELRLGDFENLIRLGAFNEKGGFHKSDTIESGLIDHYIPFLPLEEKHVRMCIADEFHRRLYGQVPAYMVESVLKDLTFGPESNPMFSNSGCKRIGQKVVTAVERLHHEL